ncbi:MAG: Bifunctional glutamine synthetase adenylyltransferase/adenylyl-removing enzyme, partial [Frankiales bacterium]|nr:Bifunctional glutamine synthetase adenylyltransferase/adenylyl-removing enzyme [Frankiales bacterium]
LPTTGRELAGLARVLGHPAGGQAELLEEYRRATRRARAVVEQIFYA